LGLLQDVGGALAGGSSRRPGLLGLGFLGLGQAGGAAQERFRLFRCRVQPVGPALQLGSLLGR
jgi:hypothetical protein